MIGRCRPLLVVFGSTDAAGIGSESGWIGIEMIVVGCSGYRLRSALPASNVAVIVAINTVTIRRDDALERWWIGLPR